MTLMPEAKLAREAEICYASVALSTDYGLLARAPHRRGSDSTAGGNQSATCQSATQNALTLIKAGLPAIAALPASAVYLSEGLEAAICGRRRCIRARCAIVLGH